jgi:hypothetical protein
MVLAESDPMATVTRIENLNHWRYIESLTHYLFMKFNMWFAPGVRNSSLGGRQPMFNLHQLDAMFLPETAIHNQTLRAISSFCIWLNPDSTQQPYLAYF